MKLDRNKLLHARERLGYGLEEVGENAGTAKNSVLRAEHEENIRPSTARKIAQALGVEVADLIKEPDSPKALGRPSPREQPSEATPEQRPAVGVETHGTFGEVLRSQVEEWLREREDKPVPMPFERWAMLAAARVEGAEDPLAEVDAIGLELRDDLNRLLHPLNGEVGQFRRSLAEAGTRRDFDERREALRGMKEDLSHLHRVKAVALLNLQERLISTETARLSDDEALGALLEANVPAA